MVVSGGTMKLVMVPWFFNIIPDAADGAGLFTHKNWVVLGGKCS